MFLKLFQTLELSKYDVKIISILVNSESFKQLVVVVIQEEEEERNKVYNNHELCNY